MKRFIPWLFALVLLLVSIPILLSNEQVLFAKIVGVIVIISTTIALRVWLRGAMKLKTKNDAVKFTVNDRFFLKEWCAPYIYSSNSEKKEIEYRAGRVLSECSFDKIDHTPVEKEECLVVAFALGSLLFEEEHQDMSNKIIVFSHENGTHRKTQGASELLFINSEELKKTVSNLERDQYSLDNLSGILKDLVLYYQV